MKVIEQYIVKAGLSSPDTYALIYKCGNGKWFLMEYSDIWTRMKIEEISQERVSKFLE